MKRTKVDKTQKGGRVSLPSEYFGSDSGRYYKPGSPELQLEPSAYGPNNVKNRSIGPAPNHSNLQTGGGIYNKIINPETGRRVSVTSKKGKQIISNYITFLEGGG